MPRSDVPLVMNDRVAAWIDYFTGPSRDRFERYMQRSGRYMAMFQQVLHKYHLPEDLAYVAMIESGFSNGATSHASAAGTWQFIQSTGRRYGLGINSWIDQRRDPERAVDAAARYLLDLYNEFGDWYLAMAGYNAGEGRVREAISRYGTKDFWELSAPGTNVFRAETREYVPKFIAAAIIAKSPQQYGFHRVNYQTPWQYEVAMVDSQTDLQVLADCAGVGMDDIRDLNPDLRAGMTPPGSHEVRLPVGTAKRFRWAFAKVPRDERVQIAYHVVRRRDTVPGIAGRYGVSTQALMAANGLRRERDLRRGARLFIPRGRSVTSSVEVASSSLPARESQVAGASPRGLREGKAMTYRVRKGDTLSGIAAQFNVALADLKSWNRLEGRRRAKLLKGQRLRILPAKEVATTEPTIALSDRALVPAAASTSFQPEAGAARDAAASPSSTRAPEQSAATSELLAMHTTTPASTSESSESIEVSAIGESSATSMPDAGMESLVSHKPAAPPVKKAQGRSGRYVVRSGDTLQEIAAKHGVTLAELKRRNGLSSRAMIRPGDKLVVGKITASTEDDISTSDTLAMTERPVKPARSSQAKSRVVHKVRPGDTIWELSRRYKVSPEQIKAWNNLPGSKLKPGQHLTIRQQSSRS
ncbi:MAG: LysM peptidoglycan-binding domain-containing protein [Deltaproteobacteria bacterium]|nr:LysM peptidoglycan-binding domain-containing protein [Deltaproteobacteria bacterium]